MLRLRAPARQLLTARQRDAILKAADQLSPPQRHAFILRCEDKLRTRGRDVSDALVNDVINRTFKQVHGASQ